MKNGDDLYSRQKIIQRFLIFLFLFAVLDTKQQFRKGDLGNKTVVGVGLLKFLSEFKLALDVINTNIGVNEVFFQSCSNCRLNLLLPRISLIISSAVCGDPQAPNAL